MANPQVDKIIGFYSSLAEGWLDRWLRIVVEGRAGTYSADAWARDAGHTLTDITSCYRFAVDYVDPPADSLVTEVPMSIAQGDAQVIQAVVIPTPPGPLKLASLAASDDPTVTIPGDRAQHWLTSSNVLVVRLAQMDQAPVPGVLTPGREFTANVHVQGDPQNVRAKIVLTVA